MLLASRQSQTHHSPFLKRLSLLSLLIFPIICLLYLFSPFNPFHDILLSKLDDPGSSIHLRFHFSFFSSSNAAPHLCFLLFAFTSIRLPSLHWPLLPWQSNNIPAIPFENFPPIQLQLFCSRTFLGFPCASSQCGSSPREGSRVGNTLFISLTGALYDTMPHFLIFTQPNPKVAQDSINAPVFHGNNQQSYFHMSMRIHVPRRACFMGKNLSQQQQERKSKICLIVWYNKMPSLIAQHEYSSGPKRSIVITEIYSKFAKQLI